jgi:hypothetical protein
VSELDFPTRTDFNKNLQQVIPQEDRDFTRPREPFMSQPAPDINFADDISSIKQLQNFLSSKPFNIPYSFSIPGAFDLNIPNVVNKFQSILKQKLPNKSIPNILNGEKINLGALNTNIKLYNELKAAEKSKATEPTKEEKTEISSKDQEPSKELDKIDELTKSFQSYFNLPTTGIHDQTLISKAKETESILAKELNDDSVKGMIWNDTKKSFNTSVDDVKSALNLIQNNKKTSSFNKKSKYFNFLK